MLYKLCRRLEGKPEVPYEDVYKFYDEKVAEYVKQYGDPYGIFTDDTTLNNREKLRSLLSCHQITMVTMMLKLSHDIRRN